MSETIDPITWLRDSTLANKPIVLNLKTNELEQENSSIRIPKDAPTAWKRKDGKGYYSIGSLWMLVRMRDAKQGDYMRESNNNGVPSVHFGDSRGVTAYFTGSVNESASIDTA